MIRTKGDFNASADWLVDNAYDEQAKVVDVVDDEKSESEKRFKIEAAGIEVGRRNMAQNVVKSFVSRFVAGLYCSPSSMTATRPTLLL